MQSGGGEGGSLGSRSRSGSRSRRGWVSKTRIAVPIPAGLFFLTALPISVAPGLSRNPEMSVPLSTRTFVFSIHSLACKGTLQQVFIRIDWRYSQSCWYFRPSFVNCCPSNLLSGSTLLPPSLCQSTVIQTVCGWEGEGVLSSVGDHILQEFNILYLTRFRNYKIARPSQTKT